jgi:hypothetical protein
MANERVSPDKPHIPVIKNIKGVIQRSELHFGLK